MFRQISIALRAAFGFGLIAALVFFLGIFSLTRIDAMQNASQDLSGNWLPGVTAAAGVNETFLRLRALTLRLMLHRTDEALRSGTAAVEELKRELDQRVKVLEGTLVNDTERAAFREFTGSLKEYMGYHDQIMEYSRQDYIDEAIDVTNGELNGHAAAATQALLRLSELNQEGAKNAAINADEVAASAFQGVIVALVLAAVLTIVLAMLLTRSITGPLNQAVGVAQVIASGDLSQDLRIEGADEPARLLQALAQMQRSLRDTIQGIADSSSQLASASEELHAVTEDSTRGLHQQNAEIEQAATAVNEMTSAVEEVARNAVSTSEASAESDRVAQHGREKVRQTVDSIGHLAEDVTATAGEVEGLAGKVRDISQVLDVIRAIAEQTNLLALNAAIEAARAGDAGRGFAVVADEVRALAHRTQQSTQEIEQMIGGIQQGAVQAVNAMQSSNSRANSTLEIAQAAGKSLDEIALAIASINERNLVIASASEEQAQVAREVDRNLVNIRDLSLQTSAGANQTSAASQELSRLAIDLNALVTRFRL
ncbi:methyl-accepting chemotaxis protein [Pseudomonas mangrovi]|uniref:Methyl-accepting chemotaxis protein n=1 Tax=Pseudomonas mangrovi TaxID=2161748 RepID=A0A2T5P7B9_9PSED|nr:methyl-accepting chemotaxis protein [Pseudomonas mangrovi]PTU73604.1 methyl-accepting chemotaxis protein [Pseudomonas mangrovi]